MMKTPPPTLAFLLPIFVGVCLIGIGVLGLIVDSPTRVGVPLLQQVLLFCLPFSLLGAAVIVLAWLRLVTPGYLAAAGMLLACSVRFFSEVADQLLGGPARTELPVYISIGTVTAITAAVMFVVGRRSVTIESEVES